MATSYRLPDERLIFPYDTGVTRYPPWIIAVRGKRGEDCELARYAPNKFGRFKTREEAQSALDTYAMRKGLKEAY